MIAPLGAAYTAALFCTTEFYNMGTLRELTNIGGWRKREVKYVGFPGKTGLVSYGFISVDPTTIQHDLL